MKSQYLLCYFLSYLDLQRILKNRQKNLNKLRDIALFKLTMMNLELRKFDHMIERLMQHIKTNHSIRAKTLSRRQRHRYHLTSTVHKDVLSFFCEEIGLYIESASQAKLQEAQDSIVNFVFKLILSQSSFNTPASKVQLKNGSSANNLPGKSLARDRSIPEEKDKPITLPSFSLRQTLMMMAEPEPEHMFVPGTYCKRPSSSEANSVPLFKTHRNLFKMQMLPTTESHFEELEVPSSKRQLDLEIDFPVAGKDFSFELAQQDVSGADSSAFSEHGKDSAGNNQPRTRQPQPTKLSLAQKSRLSAALSPEATFDPKKLATPLHTFSEAHLAQNKVDQIEEMLENYFDVNLEEVRGALVSNAPRARLQATDSNPSFSDCLLEYLEKKEIIEMEDIENYLDYTHSSKSDESAEDNGHWVASAHARKRLSSWTSASTRRSTAKNSPSTLTMCSQAGASPSRLAPLKHQLATGNCTATSDSSP